MINKIYIFLIIFFLFTANGYSQNRTEPSIVVLPRPITEELAFEFVVEMAADNELSRQVFYEFSDLQGKKGGYRFGLKRYNKTKPGEPDIFAAHSVLYGAENYKRKEELTALVSKYLQNKRLQLDLKKETSGTYFQPSTNTSFPKEIGDFYRISLLKYNEHATKIGAGYFHKKEPLPITVFAYPSKTVSINEATSIETEFEKLIEQAKISHEVTSKIVHVNYKLQTNNQTYNGIYAKIPFTGSFFSTPQTITLHTYLFEISGSFINFRMIHPTSWYHTDPNAEELFKNYMTTFIQLIKKE